MKFYRVPIYFLVREDSKEEAVEKVLDALEEADVPQYETSGYLDQIEELDLEKKDQS